jgi:hypothetical protein
VFKKIKKILINTVSNLIDSQKKLGVSKRYFASVLKYFPSSGSNSTTSTPKLGQKNQQRSKSLSSRKQLK